MGSPLLQLVPKEHRERALLKAALELLAEVSVTVGTNENYSDDDVREMIGDMLDDGYKLGVIGRSRRILNRWVIDDRSRKTKGINR